MVKVVQGDIPAEWEIFWKKIVRWYNLKGIPCYSRLWSQKMRRMKQIKYEISDFKKMGLSWSGLSPAVQQQWRDAAYQAWEYNQGYRLFTADYIYRLIAGLSVPGSPSDYHQLFGMEMSNPNGDHNVFMRRDDKDVVGQITVRLNYKKTENIASPTSALKILFTGWYLTEGGIETDTTTHTITAGNVAWKQEDFVCGVADRIYFHIRIIISIENYNAVFILDHIRLIDKTVQFYEENFVTARNVAWVPTLLYRKKDWQFSPNFDNPYFQHIYLQD